MERKNVEERSKQFYETLICPRDGQIWVQLTTQIRWDWDDQGTEMEMKPTWEQSSKGLRKSVY